MTQVTDIMCVSPYLNVSIAMNYIKCKYLFFDGNELPKMQISIFPQFNSVQQGWEVGEYVELLFSDIQVHLSHIIITYEI